jgi:phage baseplate assembly protein W
MPYKNLEINSESTVLQTPVKLSQFYRGFSSVDATKTNTKLYDFDIIKQDIVNHFNTRKGERVMNPEFGSIIWELLMEPLTDQVRELLTQDVTEICNYDPRVSPTQIQITEFESGYILELTLMLNGTDQSSKMTLTFDQKLGLVSE